MKNYLCKDCKHNNHGWCLKNKRNKLKEITECSFKISMEDTFASPIMPQKMKGFKPNIIATDHLPAMNDSARIIGKRELLYTIQRQILAMEPEHAGNTLDEFKKVLVTLNDTIDIEENIHKVQYTSEIDHDIKISSNNIAAYWRNK